MRCHQASAASRVRKASCFPLRAGFACSVVPALPLLSLFSLFPLKEKSAKKPMLAGNPCCVAIRQAQQVESAKPLAFPFGNPCRIAAQRQSRQVEWRKAPREVSLNSALFSSLVLAHFSCEKIRKIVSRYASSPLACIKFCLQNFLRPKGYAFVKASPWGEAVAESD